MNLQFIQQITGIIVGLGILAAALGYLFTQFFRGGSEALKSDTERINFFQKEAKDYKEMMASDRKEFTAKIETLTRQVGELRGQLEGEKKLREQYEALIKDRNPETEKFREFMVKAVEDQNNVNKEVVNVLKEIFIMTKAEHDKDFKVEITTTKQ